MRDDVRKSRDVCLHDESADGAAIAFAVRGSFNQPVRSLGLALSAAGLSLLSYLGGNALAL